MGAVLVFVNTYVWQNLAFLGSIALISYFTFLYATRTLTKSEAKFIKNTFSF